MIVHALFHHLQSLVGPQQLSNETSLLLVHEGFAEICRSCGERTNDPSTAMSSSMVSMIGLVNNILPEEYADIIKISKPKSLVFMLATDDIQMFLPMIKDIAIFAQGCTTIYVFSTCFVAKVKEIEKQLADAIFDAGNLPVTISFIYLPLHSVPIVNKGNNDSIAILGCDNVSKYTFPLTLSQIRDWKNATEFGSVKDIKVNDLSDEDRNVYKKFSQELALALVVEYGLDASKNLYTLGNTAKLIGPTILSELEETIDMFTTLKEYNGPSRVKDGLSMFAECIKDSFIGERNGLSCILENKPFQSASLIVVDRLEDVFTPMSSSRNSSVAHELANQKKEGAGQFTNNCSIDTQLPICGSSSQVADKYVLLDTRHYDEMLYLKLMQEKDSEAFQHIASSISSSMSISPEDSLEERSIFIDLCKQYLENLQEKRVENCVEDITYESKSSLVQIIINNYDDKNNHLIDNDHDFDQKLDESIMQCFNFNSTLKAVLKIFEEEEKQSFSLLRVLIGIIRIQSITRYTISSSDTSEFSDILSQMILDKCSIEELEYVSDSLFSSDVFQSILEYKKCCDNGSSFENIAQLKLQVGDVINDFLVISQEIGNLRTINEENNPGDFTDIFSGLQNGNTRDCLGLIPRLMTEILSMDTTNIPSSLKVSGNVISRIDNSNKLLNLAKAGLGMIWSSVKSQEVDHTPLSENIVVIVVLGGISYHEIKQIHQVKQNQQVEKIRNVVVIATSITGRNTLFEKLVNFRRIKNSAVAAKVELYRR